MKHFRALAVGIVALSVPGTCAPPPSPPPAANTAPALGAIGDQWVRVEANLLSDSVESVVELARTANASGADTVLFSDTKTSNWYASDYKDQWLAKILQVQAAVRAEGMAFVVTTASVGYCAPILQLDPSIANSMPITDTPLTVRGGALVPDQTASLLNGSFEASSAANTPADWGFQDPPGVTTFIDTGVVADGAASMRFEGSASTEASKMARISTTASVRPNQQYVLRYKFRSENLDASFIGPIVRGGDTEITLTNQHPSLPTSDGGRSYFQGATDLTTGWAEMELAFNSREFDTVNLFFGTWGSSGGTAWVDDVRIEPAPTLNVVRRDSLPVELTKANGTAVVEGVDVTPIADPLLGNIAYPGNFDTYHDAPTIKALAGGGLAEGDRVSMSGYHAQLTASGQVGCAWNEPRTFELMRATHRQVARRINPDGILIDLEEIRTGGWEPTDAPFSSTGAALAAHVKRVLDDATEVVRGKPLFVWNDMLDPTLNARPDFYQVKGDLTGSWIGVNPARTRIINWRSGVELKNLGRAGVQHFARLGFEQIAAGYYDENVAENHAAWATATAGQPRIIGSMYTTWTGNFGDMDEFAALWWTD
jgi:hypothetical protein